MYCNFILDVILCLISWKGVAFIVLGIEFDEGSKIKSGRQHLLPPLLIFFFLVDFFIWIDVAYQNVCKGVFFY